MLGSDAASAVARPGVGEGYERAIERA